MKKTIIFDLDGVIVLSDPGQFRVLQHMFRRYGLTLPKRTYPELIGRTSHDFLSNLSPRLSPAMIENIYNDYKKEFQDHLLTYIEPIWPTVRFIRSYKGPLRFALASMSSKETIITETTYLKIRDKFRVLVSREEVKNHKPDPEIYLLTAKKLGVKPRDCAVVEDSVIGIQAARRAGMQCYVFLNGINKRSQFSRFNVKGFIRTHADYKRIL